MKKEYDALILFSGGLDSLLAAKILKEQGLKILCLHFISPFFGNRGKIPVWEKIWDLEILPVDISGEFCSMLVQQPPFGFGSVLNPCIDCKIMILRKAKEMLSEYNAKFLATGEVLGQRPMSQRKESLNLIKKQAGVRDILLRPLSALHLEPTPMEIEGLVKRELLYGINGRGRNEQLELVKKFSIESVPSPAGGCLLTEIENGRRYWPIIKRLRNKQASEEEILEEFTLGRMGRQFWLDNGSSWLCVGRNREDNQALLQMCRSGDVTLKLRDYSGPIALAKEGKNWKPDTLIRAAEILASYSREAKQAGKAQISILGNNYRKIFTIDTKNRINTELPEWSQTRKEIGEANSSGKTLTYK